jgi:PilZ domain-containing protein
VSHDFTDKRQHQRIEAVQAIFIEVVDRGSRSEAENKIVRCETVDVSVGGLRVLLPDAIETGSRLNLAVPMDGWKENLELVGEAKWCGEAEGKPGYWVGLELKDTSRENMEKWCKIVHLMSRN